MILLTSLCSTLWITLFSIQLCKFINYTSHNIGFCFIVLGKELGMDNEGLDITQLEEYLTNGTDM